MRALFNQAISRLEAGDPEACLPLLSEALERARRTGLLSSPYPLEMRYLQLLVLYTVGRWDACLRAAAEAAAVLPATGAFAAGPALYVAVARGELGAVERAEALLDGPFTWTGTLVAGIALTDSAALRGDPEAAVERMRAALTALGDDSGRRPDVTVRLAALCLAAVADRAGELRRAGDAPALRRWADTATELVEQARASAARDEEGRPQGPEGQAWLARAEAEWATAVSGPVPAVWEKAVAAFSYGDVYEQARCRARYAEALLAVDRRAEAAEEARTARKVAVALGAAPLLERIDALSRRGRLTAASADAAGGASLTARERDVLGLLARGRSNRQIGEELFISGKTASVHVSNILAKLGAASRTEAVAIAYRQGLIAPEPSGTSRPGA